MLVLPALAWDLMLGEPPAAIHPVVWVGKLISLAERAIPQGPRMQLLGGAAVTLCLVLLAVLLGLGIEHLPQPWRWGVALFFFKSTFSVRELLASGKRVAMALLAGELESARSHVKRIVSRPVEGLDEPRLAAAAVQSVAENLADSVVAPLFYFTLFGLPGALAYRVANTLDAMIGYRGRYEYFGKAAARLDDVLNLVPARLTAMIMLLLGTLMARPGWGVWWRDRKATASPNGGHPIAAAAGILEVHLEKVGHYRLGDGPPPGARTILQMNRYAFVLALLVAGASALLR